MCSIYGTSSRSMLDVLHDASIDRGNYACSFTSISKGKIHIHKMEGHPKSMDSIEIEDNAEFYLGHNQAPTSSQRKYNSKTSHPFECGDWIVAHNGVLTNFEKLNKHYTPSNKNPVDSSVIPAILNYFTVNYTDINDVEIIQQTLNLLEGTFAVWIYNKPTNKIYLARQGSTLFANFKTRDFCSIQSNGWKELEEGKIYEILKTKIVSRIEFKNKTPFFTL